MEYSVHGTLAATILKVPGRYWVKSHSKMSWQMVGLVRGSISRDVTSYPRSLSLVPTDPVPENKSRALPLETLREPESRGLEEEFGKEELELGWLETDTGTLKSEVIVDDDVGVDHAAVDGLDDGGWLGLFSGVTENRFWVLTLFLGFDRALRVEGDVSVTLGSPP